MDRILHFIAFVSIALFCLGCKGESKTTAGLAEMDLMKYGMPIKIKAPPGAKVDYNDMGIMKDVTVAGDDNYSLQISSGVATTTNVASVVAEQKSYVKSAAFFDEIVHEDEYGFIYRKKISETRENHDFRYIKIQGNQEYIFQTGLMGQYSINDVKRMYDSVK